MSISLRSNPDGSGTLLNGSTPVMEITAAGVVSLPNIAAGSSANQPVNLGQVIGVGQTWQDVTASRSLGVTYTNNTGKPIVVVAYTHYGATGDIYGYVTPYNIEYAAEGTGNTNTRLHLIVPDGSQYSITKTSGTGTISKWYELR